MRELRKRNEVKSESPLEDIMLDIFRRHGVEPLQQFEIGRYRVDFALPKIHLIVEVDGIIHEEQKKYDVERDQWLKRQGWDIVRLQGTDVYRIYYQGNITELVAKIFRKERFSTPLRQPQYEKIQETDFPEIIEDKKERNKFLEEKYEDKRRLYIKSFESIKEILKANNPNVQY